MLLHAAAKLCVEIFKPACVYNSVMNFCLFASMVIYDDCRQCRSLIHVSPGLGTLLFIPPLQSYFEVLQVTQRLLLKSPQKCSGLVLHSRRVHSPHTGSPSGQHVEGEGLRTTEKRVIASVASKRNFSGLNQRALYLS